ncbi:MAG: hypothetical protein NVS9B15_15370 [Acidobacteriaceae bacterium]
MRSLEQMMRGLLRTLSAGLLLFIAAAHGQVRPIDLKQYGLQGASNSEYRAHLFTSAIDYLADGTLVVAFPAPFTTLDSKRVRIPGVQRSVVLHLDPSSGTMLHSFEAQLTNEIRSLYATPDGRFLLIEGHDIVFFDPQCIEVARLAVPQNVVSIDVSPSRRFLTMASGAAGALTLTVFDTATRAQVRQQQAAGTPVALLGNGYALIKRYTTSGGRVGHRTVIDVGYKVQFFGDQERDTDIGFVLDCPVVFQSVRDDAVAFATCGSVSFVSSSGRKIMKDKLGHATALTFQSSLQADRVAYAAVPGSFERTPAELRAQAQSMTVRVADLQARKVVGAFVVSPLPKVGGAIALSPDGKQLAVLTDSAVEFIQVK